MSFALWVREVESLEIPAGADSLTDALGCWDRYTALVIDAVGAFDRSREWETEGATSVIGWLRTRRVAGGDAARFALLARRFAALPVLASAALAGELSNAQVRVIALQIPDRHVALFAEHEAELVPSLVGLSVVETTHAMVAWRARADALDGGPGPADPVNELHLSTTLDNRGQISGTLDADGTAVLSAALRMADSNDFGDPVPQRRAEALVTIARHFLDNQQSLSGGRHRPHVNIVIQAGSLGTGHLVGEIADTRMQLDSPTLSKYLCDCAMHRVQTADDNSILNYGRAARTPPASLFNAVVVRDRHCRFPGCDRPPTWCDAHHVVWWENGGPTNLNNLVLVCARHHKILHKPGWTAVTTPDGQLVITTPLGLTRSTRPPPPPGQQFANSKTRPKRKTRIERDNEIARQRVDALTPV